MTRVKREYRVLSTTVDGDGDATTWETFECAIDAWHAGYQAREQLRDQTCLEPTLVKIEPIRNASDYRR